MWPEDTNPHEPFSFVVHAWVTTQVGPSFKPTKRVCRAAKETNIGFPFEEAQSVSTVTVAWSNCRDADKGIESGVNQIRGYMDLLDEYSLHHFIIWKGKAIRDTPEFESLVRAHQQCWSFIDRCVTVLEKVMTMNDVLLAVIDGKKLSDLARFHLDQVDLAELYSCVTNLEQIRPFLCEKNLPYITGNEVISIKKKAAVKIQVMSRRFLERSKNSLARHQRNAAVKLQCFVRGRRSSRIVATLLVKHRRDAESKWKGLKTSLRENWESWRKSDRVLVILPSTGNNPAEDLLISHGHWLMDPKVHVVCILPCLPDRDVLEYSHKILELTRNIHVPNRMTVVIPENVDLFQNRLSLASSLLYSPSSLKRIGRIIEGRPAMIVSYKNGWQNKKLALALGAPLLSTEPSIAALLQTQSGMKRLFAAADVCSPLGACDVYDEEDLLVSLTQLMVCNLEVRRWHIKLDVCRGNWGLAIMDTSTLPCITELRKEKAQLERVNGSLSNTWHHPDVQLLARARLLKALRRVLHRAISICRTEVYETWTHFLGHMLRVGGVIEAEAPEIRSHLSASFFVSPTGSTIFLSESEVLCDACYEDVGSVYPQECVPTHALRGATAAISRELYSRGVVGYVSVEFVVFWDGQADSLRLWATGLELGLSTSTFGFFLFRLFTRGTEQVRDLGCFEEPASVGNIDHQDRSLRFVYLDHVRHPSLQSLTLTVFFKLCRLEGISFDLATQVGTVFELAENLVCGALGLLTISHTRRAAVERAMGTLTFIKHIVSVAVDHGLTLKYTHDKSLQNLMAGRERHREIRIGGTNPF